MLIWCKTIYFSSHTHDSSFKINFQFVGHKGRTLPLRACTPQYCTNARQQFSNGYGLDHIVVGPSVQRSHFISFAMLCRENKDRRVTCTPHLATQIQASVLCCIKVHEDKIRTRLTENLQSIVIVYCLRDTMPLDDQSVEYHSAELWVDNHD
jgi:hypothetical protein